MPPTDIVILSNGPGEIITWVRPVVQALSQVFSPEIPPPRVSVILSPCPHSTGQEADIVASYPQVDRVLAANNFWQFLLWGSTPENWQWHPHGIVVFLGGDQFYTVVISKRLGYASLIYAEWSARWYRYTDRFAVMNSRVLDPIPHSYHHKFSIVGDLMAEVAGEAHSSAVITDSPQIGLLVGSKPAKLAQGVPLCLAIAEQIQQQLPQAKFMIPIAPTVSITELEKYANSKQNPLIASLGGVTGSRSKLPELADYLITSGGTKIKLIQKFPAYQDLANCQLCITTVGANTAELTALQVPMIVLLPTQQLDAMRSWDGLPGILANLPVVGSILAKLINWVVLQQGRLFAWPNIWAKQEIVPELVGKLEPNQVAELALDFLQNPQKLAEMRQNLGAVRGETGAAVQIADIIGREITKT